MHSMQMGLEQCTISVHTEILCKYIGDIQILLYQNIPSSHFPAQLPFHCIVQLIARVATRLWTFLCHCANTFRMYVWICTCAPDADSDADRVDDVARTHTHAHLKKSTKIKRKQQILERRQIMWRKAMMAQAQAKANANAHNCRHASLLRARARRGRAAERVCVCAWEAKIHIQRAHDCIGIFIQAARAAYHTHTHTTLALSSILSLLCVCRALYI